MLRGMCEVYAKNIEKLTHADQVIMKTFPELVASRREWIDNVLKPWCQQASRKELLFAEQEWTDLAGRAAPEMTLWLWAWSRFPVLYEDGLTTINETRAVQVHTRTGQEYSGFPDSRQSEQGRLVLVGEDGEHGPISIDDISNVQMVVDS